MRGKAIPRFLLLTGTAPTPDGVGGIILDDLSRFLSNDRLAVAHVVQNTKARETLTSSGTVMRGISVPYDCRPESKWGRPGRAIAWLGMWLRNRRSLQRGTVDCVAFAKDQAVTEIWAVLDVPATIEMAVSVARQLDKPLKVMVWDDIEHNIRYFGLDRLTAKRLRRRFAVAVRHAVRCAVIGETMQAEYSKRYGRIGVIVRHGADQFTVPRTTGEDVRTVRIGFAGSVTARTAFDQLLATLDDLNWEIAGRPVTLVLMGGRFDLWSRVPRRIECLGWRSVQQTIEALSGCTLNYLPQPFEPDWRPFSELSFPSKLTTYLAAGVPILLHSPANASLPRFLAKHPFGELCTELDSSLLKQALRRIALDHDLRLASVAAAKRALSEDFSTKRFHSSFAEFLGVQLDPDLA